jgi:hypothetical protein
LTGLLAGLLYFGNDDPFLEPCVARIMALLELDLDVNLRFATGHSFSPHPAVSRPVPAWSSRSRAAPRALRV